MQEGATIEELTQAPAGRLLACEAPPSSKAAAYHPGITRYLHTMYRITEPEKSRAFYEALGFEFRRELPIVRDGELEATNYFFGMPGQQEELELTFNHDGRSYDLGTGYGHIAIGVNDLDATLARLREQGSSPSVSRTVSARADRDCVSSATPTPIESN